MKEREGMRGRGGEGNGVDGGKEEQERRERIWETEAAAAAGLEIAAGTACVESARSELECRIRSGRVGAAALRAAQDARAAGAASAA